MRTAVRIAEESDVSTLAALRRAWMEENAGGRIDDPDFEAAFREWWKTEHDTRTFFLLEVDGLAVGMANVKRYIRMPATGRASAGQWGYVGNVFVLATRRDAGLGQVLMDEVLAWAGREGLVHLRLAPSPRSVPFYARLGYLPGAVVELDPPT
jgi:GNAT superfamily N-acetyltransferase